MRGIVTVSVLVSLGVVSALAGAPDAGLRTSGFSLQTFAPAVLGRSPAQSAPPSPQAPSQLPPVFRGEVDLIRLDVSVLERDRRPMTGLAESDFTVVEDGVTQKISAFTEILVPDRDPKPTAWMRSARPDVATNDLVDQLGEGRPYAIVMDDWNIPAEDLFLVNGARAAGREIVSRLGPSDVAAVVFVHESQRTVDFTTDRGRLLEAINGFEGRKPKTLPTEWQTTTPGPRNPLVPKSPAAPWTPGGAGAAGGDVASRPLIDCQHERPLIPTLETVARRLAMVPNRRKSIVLVTVGSPLWRVVDEWNTLRAQPIGPGKGMQAPGGACRPVEISDIRHVYGVAEQANINIYTVDVSDDQRFSQSLERSVFRRFLEDVAHYTGGLVVGANGESVATSAERVFAEAGSYYLIGYQSSNGAPDGKYRRVEVRVNRPYVTVRSRSGYFAAALGEDRRRAPADLSSQTPASLAPFLMRDEERARLEPSARSLALTGLYPATGLPMRVQVVPVGLTSSAGRSEMDVAIALSIRLPPARAPINETVTLTRQLYDAKGRPGSPTTTTETFTVSPTAGDETRYDFFQRLTLPPGRHEIRLNARSAAVGRDGSVVATVDVPDVARAPVALSGIVLGRPAVAEATRADALANLLPIVPTSARSFAGPDTVAAFFQVFQGGTSPATPVTVRVVILNQRDQPVLDRLETLTVDAFGDRRGVARQFLLPLSELTPGPYVLNITARRPDGTSARRDVVFKIR